MKKTKVVKCFSCKYVFNKDILMDEDGEAQAIDTDEHVYRIMSYKDGKKRNYCRFCAVKKFIFENFRVRFDWSDEAFEEFVDKYNAIVMNGLIKKGFFNKKINEFDSQK